MVLSLLVPLIIGIVVEMLWPGVLNTTMLIVSALLCVLIAFLIKINDSTNHHFRPYMLLGVSGLMFSLGALCLSSLRVDKLQSLCDKSSPNSVLVAHISSEFKTSPYGATCLADVYCYDDSLQSVANEEGVQCRLNLQGCAESLSAGDIIMIPKNAVSTADKNDFAQFVYDRFLNMQGIQAVCDVDTFKYISHLAKSGVTDRACLSGEYLKNTLKKTKF